MAKESDRREVVTLGEVVLAHMSESGALMNVLERKGVVRKAEVVEKVRRLWDQAAKAHVPVPGLPPRVLALYTAARSV